MKPILLALLMFVLAAHEAHAEVPARVTFSARLVNGTTVFNGPVQVDLRLFRDPNGGTSIWTESHAPTAEAGLVSLAMGEKTPLDATVIDGNALYLEVTVDGTALSPRLAIGSAPYALLAGRAETAAKLSKSACTRVFKPNGELMTQTVYCPAGHIVIGGGCTTGGTAGVLDSVPATDSSWRCETAPNYSVRAHAICCQVSM